MKKIVHKNKNKIETGQIILYTKHSGYWITHFREVYLMGYQLLL